MMISKTIDFKNKLSKSEQNGIKLLHKDDLRIFCPGISTCGWAEIQMAKLNPKRQIIATTINKKGLKVTKKIVKEQNLLSRIKLKFEDLRDPMPYKNDYFDFTYARLVLHYLSNGDLKIVLKQLHRVLKPKGRIYIVVRSVKEWEAKLPGTIYDENTGFTTYPLLDQNMKCTGKKTTRRLHSNQSIKNFLVDAGFRINYIKEYKEQLYHDYLRTIKTPKLSSLIEVLATKK